MYQDESEAKTAIQEVEKFLDSLEQLFIAEKLAPDFIYKINVYKNELNQIKNKWENIKSVAEITDLSDIAQEEFKQVTREAEELRLQIEQQILTTKETQTNVLPDVWEDIKPDTVYQTKSGMLVSFSKKQIFFAKTKDREANHIRAIDKGEVPPQGNQGLVRSEEPGFDLKSKALGKGTAHYRFHGKMINGILYFPGKVTNKK